MTTKQQHVLIAQRIKIGNSTIFLSVCPLAPRLIEGAHEFPLLKVRRLKQSRAIRTLSGYSVSDEGVIDIAFQPSTRVKYNILAVSFLTGGRHWDHRVGWMLVPLNEQIIIARCDAGSIGNTMIDERRGTLSTHKSTTTETSIAVWTVKVGC